MFRNYLKHALRLIIRNKTFSVINITGVALGTVCCLYILLYVNDQRSYDAHHRNADRIFRVNSMMKVGGEAYASAASSPPIGPTLKNDFSEVDQFTRVIPAIGVAQHLLRYNDRLFYENELVFVDSTFFQLFSYRFVYGDPDNALQRPNSIVILKSLADKIFGQSDPVGKQLEIDNDYGKNDFTITGVVDRIGKSHVQANVFVTMNSGGIGEYVLRNTMWAGNNFAYTFIKLRAGIAVTDMEKKFPSFLKKYGDEQLKTVGMEKRLELQPVASIHTTTDYTPELMKTVSPAFLNILLLIALLIQVIACINFMNLSTARASKRAKEVGVRKVAGANRYDLMRQFIGESFIWSVLGVALAVGLLLLAMPVLNDIAQADVSVNFLKTPAAWQVLGLLIFFTTLFAGSYPAFYLSAFRVVKVLKGNFTSHISASGIRKSLVVFQFVLSIVLISGFVVIYSQLRYMQQMDLGYDKDQKLVFNFHTHESRKHIEAFLNAVSSLPEVTGVSRANNYPGQFYFNDALLYPQGKNHTEVVGAQFMMTDEHFIDVLKIPVVHGRKFHAHDSGRVIINETYARQLGLDPGKAIGTRIMSPPGGSGFNFEIAGIMKDFNANSLRENIKPFMLVYRDKDASMSKVIVSTHTEDYSGLREKLSGVWQAQVSGTPFEFTFLDEVVQKQYESEITLSRIINSFTVMAILISCLGLFGLAAFNAEQRMKEIGIRKVLGATEGSIVELLSRDFMKLVLIALVIAVPLSWWSMNEWLKGFAYRIDMAWWMFAISGAVAVLISLVTVSFQTVRAALSNPVKNLRTE